MWFVSDVVQGFSLVLQVLLLSFLLLQSYYRKYPLLFGYRLTYLATSILEVALVHHFGTRLNSTYTFVYWTDEVVLDLLQFLLVIALTYRAMEGNPSRPVFGRFFGLVVIIMVLVPLLIFRRPLFSNHWFYQTSQLLNFGAGVMNLALWTALLGSKRRDPQLLVVSAGLGLAVTANAISFGIRVLGAKGVPHRFADALSTAADLFSLVIWCWAFQPKRKTVVITGAGVPSQ
jgi:hypothetical protein